MSHSILVRPTDTFHFQKITELRLGTYLGEGGFCVVTEVSQIDLDPNADESYEEDMLLDNDGKIIQDRKFIASNVARDGCKRYAIKKLSPQLVQRSSGTFVSGVIDLAMEVKYLSIVQVCSVAFGG